MVVWTVEGVNRDREFQGLRVGRHRGVDDDDRDDGGGEGGAAADLSLEKEVIDKRG